MGADQHDLPWYVLDDPDVVAVAAVRPANVKVTALVRRGIDALDRLSEDASPLPPLGGGSMEPPRRPLGDTAIIRHLFCPPDVAAAGFDRWLSQASAPRRAHGGVLWLRGPLDPLPSQLRLVEGRVRLRRSPVRIPVEIELASWGQWRAVLFLRPRRRWSYLVRRRGPVWFPAGSALLDRARDEIEALAAEPAAVPSAEPAGAVVVRSEDRSA